MLTMTEHGFIFFVAEEDGGQTVCKDTIRFLANLRSAKEHRYNKEKHVLLDIVPEDGEIVVRSKKKHRGLFMFSPHLPRHLPVPWPGLAL
jgi:hypothetical protein